MRMRSSASRLVLLIRRWGLMRWAATRPALTTPWRVGAGGSHTGSTPGAGYTTATLLPNGIVLVAGRVERNFIISGSAELYDPAGKRWAITGSLNTARFSHTATLLQNGMVVVAGGGDRNNNASARAELYDPASGT